MAHTHAIYFYETINGKKVIEEFIDKLDETTKARTQNAINLLKEYGLISLKDTGVSQ